MKKFAKRVAALLLAGTFLCLSAPAAFADDYWAAQSHYQAAVNAGNDEEILKAVKEIEAVYPNPSDKTECTRVMFPVRKAATVYEKQGKFEDAAAYYRKFLSYVNFMIGCGEDYTDYLNTTEMLIRHNSVTPTVYAETKNPDAIPYRKAKSEQRAGTVSGMSGNYEEGLDGGQILYVQYFNEEISGFRWMLPQTLPDDFLLEVAWNTPNETLEELEQIASKKSDEYMIRNLKYLETLNCRVLLRFGAEVNCWASLPDSQEAVAKQGQKFIDTFIKAFRRVSTMAKTYAPNVAMVYSPNDVSNWYFSPMDFYPGDDYVDWVGISAYWNAQTPKTYTLSNGNDAYYCHGDYYGDQMIRIASVFDLFRDRKPLVISESGFCYQNTAGTQTLAHAKASMQYFYTYLTRVFPEVKAVFHFNTNFGGNHYQLFGANGNAELGELYRDLTANDAAIRYSRGKSDVCGYTKLTSINEVTDSLNLSVYAHYPTAEKTTVRYTLDGKKVKETAAYPYSCEIAADTMKIGVHDLTVTTTCAKTVNVQTFRVLIGAGSKVTVTASTAQKIQNEIKNCKHAKWVTASEVVPTCTEKGTRTLVCSVCGKTKTESIPTVPHPYELIETTREPVGHLHGEGVFRCPVCGEEKTDVICVSAQFTDVGSYKNWAHESIDYCVANGLLSGTSQTTFERETKMTRAMLVTVLWRLSGSPEPDGINPFSDVNNKTGSWYYKAVLWAAQTGVVSGTGADLFSPNGNVTREQIASILYRYTGMLRHGTEPTDGADLSAFPDAGKVSGWARRSLSWANAVGMISGAKVGEQTLLNPLGEATRAEVAAILMRYVENIVKAPIDPDPEPPIESDTELQAEPD